MISQNLHQWFDSHALRQKLLQRNVQSSARPLPHKSTPMVEAPPAVPVDNLETMPFESSPVAKRLQMDPSPKKDLDLNSNGKTGPLVRRVASSHLTSSSGHGDFVPEVPDTYIDSPGLDSDVVVEVHPAQEQNEPINADESAAVGDDIMAPAGEPEEDSDNDEDLFNAAVQVSRQWQLQEQKQLKDAKKKKELEEGADPEEGPATTKTEKAKEKKDKKSLAKAKAMSKQALAKAKAKFLKSEKSKQKAEAAEKKKAEKAEAAEKKKAEKADVKPKKKKEKAKENVQVGGKAKRLRRAVVLDGGDAPQDDPAVRADPSECPPCPIHGADGKETKETKEKKTFARRNRPTQSSPAARFDSIREVFNQDVKGQVKNFSAVEATWYDKR